MMGFTAPMPTGVPTDMGVDKDPNNDVRSKARVLDRIRRERERNRPVRNLARLHMDYYLNNVVTGMMSSDTPYAIENRIAPLVDQVACRIAETRPTGTCVPVNNEEQERDAARQRDDLLYSEFNRAGLYTEKTYLLAQGAAVTGSTFLAVHWDPKTGSHYTPSEDERQLMAKFQEAVAAGIPDLCEMPVYLDGSYGELMTGGITIECLDIHEFGYDPFANDLQSSTWCYRRTYPLKEEAEYRWPEYADRLLPVSTKLDMTAPDDGSKARLSNTDRVQVDVYYERPHPGGKYPRGAVIYCTDTMILEVVPELPFGVFPFWEVRDAPVIRRASGLGRVRNLVPLARELNNRRQRLKEQLDKAGGVNIMVPQGAMLGQSFLDEVVNVYTYDSGHGRPEQFQLQPNPAQALNISDTRNAMNEIGGLPEYMRGKMPSGISGRTIGLYDSQVATLLGQLARSLGRAIQGLAQWTLEAWKEYAPPEAEIVVAGTAGGYASRKFSKRAITSTRWVIDEASTVPRNQGYQREQLMAFAQVPILTQAPPRVRNWFVKQMEFPNSSGLLRDTGPAAVYARGVVENLLSEQWVWPDTSDAENEEVIRDVVRDARFGSLYDKATPKARTMVEQYLDWSEWVITSMTKGGMPGYMLRQAMIALNGDWTKPPPPPGQPPSGAAPPGPAGPPPGPVPDVFGPDPAPSGEMPPDDGAAIMAAFQQAQRPPGSQVAPAPVFASPGQPMGPGTEA